MVSIDLFAEDQAHETFVSAVVDRIMSQSDVDHELNIRIALGGHGRALTELRVYQRAILRGDGGLNAPDLLVVIVDANCKGPVAARSEIQQILQPGVAGDVVIACPDPHIERWFFADPAAFANVVGANGQIGKRKCERDFYKAKLKDAVIEGGNVPVLDGIEFASEVVNAMDMVRASQNEPTLGSLVEGVRAFAARHIVANGAG